MPNARNHSIVKILVAALLSTIALVPATVHKVFVFGIQSTQVTTVTQRVLRDVVSVTRVRFQCLGVSATVVERDGQVSVTVPATAPADTESTLASTGNVVFRITPRGPTLRSKGGRYMRSAFEVEFPSGKYIVAFTPADPSSFYRFTSARAGQQLGLYVDGHLQAAIYIQSPIGRHGEIAGLSEQQALTMAALISSGPLPARVRLLRVLP